MGLKLSTSTMSFSIRVLPPLNKEQKITFLLLLHPKHWQVQACRVLLVFRALNSTGLTWDKQNISYLVCPRWILLVDRVHFFTECTVRCDSHQILPALLTKCWVAWYHLRQGVKLSDQSTAERHLGLFPVGSVVMAGLFKSLDAESRRKNVPV